jgi:hypothetical protein
VRLLPRREHIDDPIHRGCGTPSVQRGEDQVPRFSRGKSQRYRLEISQLSNEYHIRVLSKRGSQRGGKRRDVPTNLPLRNATSIGGMNKLDWVFNRHEVTGHCLINAINHRGQRGALTRSGGAGDEHQALIGAR